MTRRIVYGFSKFWWAAPEYFSRWRLFPRAFIIVYLYLLVKVVNWAMALETLSMEQAGLVSVIVGAGAAWFAIYTNSKSTPPSHYNESEEEIEKIE